MIFFYSRCSFHILPTIFMILLLMECMGRKAWQTKRKSNDFINKITCFIFLWLIAGCFIKFNIVNFNCLLLSLWIIVNPYCSCWYQKNSPIFHTSSFFYLFFQITLTNRILILFLLLLIAAAMRADKKRKNNFMIDVHLSRYEGIIDVILMWLAFGF